jgi:hypothetical protein
VRIVLGLRFGGWVGYAWCSVCVRACSFSRCGRGFDTYMEDYFSMFVGEIVFQLQGLRISAELTKQWYASSINVVRQCNCKPIEPVGCQQRSAGMAGHAYAEFSQLQSSTCGLPNLIVNGYKFCSAYHTCSTSYSG